MNKTIYKTCFMLHCPNSTSRNIARRLLSERKIPLTYFHINTLLSHLFATKHRKLNSSVNVNDHSQHSEVSTQSSTNIPFSAKDRSPATNTKSNWGLFVVLGIKNLLPTHGTDSCKSRKRGVMRTYRCVTETKEHRSIPHCVSHLFCKHIPGSNVNQTDGQSFCIFCMWKIPIFHKDQICQICINIFITSS